LLLVDAEVFADDFNHAVFGRRHNSILPKRSVADARWHRALADEARAAHRATISDLPQASGAGIATRGAPSARGCGPQGARAGPARFSLAKGKGNAHPTHRHEAAARYNARGGDRGRG